MISQRQSFIVWLTLGLALAGCSVQPMPVAPPIDRDPIAATLMRDISVLASDEFGGRLPGTDGEVRTLGFLIDSMREAGFESGTNDPGNPWRAPVALISTEPSDSRIVLRTRQGETALDGDAAVAYTTLRRVLINAEDLVFVGWESEGLDPDLIRGKVVVMLGEPGLSPGRREILFDMNPAAVITIVETSAGIEAIRRANERSRLILRADDSANVSAFVTREAVSAVIGAETWSDLMDRAGQEAFQTADIPVQATIEINSKRREFTSYNVVGRLPGTAPDAGSVLLLAHWDHLGECGPEGSENRVCNGAVDNASGLAVKLELARRLTAAGPYDRDIYLLATTAEEAGLLGIRAFVDQPAMPLDTIVAAFNFDTAAVAPAGSPVGLIGEGRTSLDPVIEDVLAEMGRSLGNRSVSDQFLQRQDSWTLLQEGVPAVVLSTTFGSQITLDTYLSERYHKPNDQIDGIELGGAIDDLLLHEALIKRVADSETFPATGE